MNNTDSYVHNVQIQMCIIHAQTPLENSATKKEYIIKIVVLIITVEIKFELDVDFNVKSFFLSSVLYSAVRYLSRSLFFFTSFNFCFCCSLSLMYIQKTEFIYQIDNWILGRRKKKRTICIKLVNAITCAIVCVAKGNELVEGKVFQWTAFQY